jgi:hypothetical protein
MASAEDTDGFFVREVRTPTLRMPVHTNFSSVSPIHRGADVTSPEHILARVGDTSFGLNGSRGGGHNGSFHQHSVHEERLSRSDMSIADRSAAFIAGREEKRRRLADQLQAKEASSATFSPATNHRPMTPRKDAAPVGDRLHQEAVERRQRREQRKAALTAGADSASYAARPSPSASAALRHVDDVVHELQAWESSRRAKVQRAKEATEAAAAAACTGCPRINPISRAIAASAAATATPRVVRASSPVQPPREAPAISTVARDALVQRLYYRDAEVRHLEQQLAAVRSDQERRRASTPQVTRRTAALAGAALPSQQAVHERLLREGARIEERRREAEDAANRSLNDSADVGRYLGPITHVLSAVVKARAQEGGVATPRQQRRRASQSPERACFTPNINPASAKLDKQLHGGCQPRTELLFGQARLLQEQAAQVQRHKENAEAAAARKAAEEGKRLARAEGYGGPSKGVATEAAAKLAQPFAERQANWTATRELAHQRRRQEAVAARTTAEEAECTFTPRTCKAPPGQRQPKSPEARVPTAAGGRIAVTVSLFDTPQRTTRNH